MDAKPVVLQNEMCTAAFNSEGGALVQWQLHSVDVNPFQFCWQEGVKGKTDVFFRGHFLCLGRWGDPSAAEAAIGHIKHGDFNRLHWQTELAEKTIKMSAQSELEGLAISREVNLHKSTAVMQVRETVHNILPVGRLYNMMQHPTLSVPFLDSETIVDCNASVGFDYAFDTYNEKVFSKWPDVLTADGSNMNLVQPDKAYSSVFPFIVNPNDAWGWMTAYSPTHKLLLGYVWKRTDYPWIAHWLHFEEGSLTYRGLEFGTTGIHQPIAAIWGKDMLKLLNEPTCCFIDAGEKEMRSYTCFLHEVPQGFNGVDKIEISDKSIIVTPKKLKGKTDVLQQLNIHHEL